jgi:hypothetical protein
MNITMMSNKSRPTLRLPAQRRRFVTAATVLVVCIMAVRIERGLSFLSPHYLHQHEQRQRHQHPPSSSSPPSSLFSTTSKRPRSRVSDPSGATPPLEEVEYPKLKMEDLPEMQYDQYKPIIPHQPWRRGETAGCADPIDAPWRKEAERLIRLAVEMVGGTYIDVTWYLTFVVVTIGDIQAMPRDCYPPDGPMVRWTHTQDEKENIFIDPDDPNPDPIWGVDELNKVMYERDLNADLVDDIKSKTYARPDKEEGETDDDLGLDPDQDIPLYVDQEFHEDERLRLYLQKQLEEATSPKEENMSTLRESLINKEALSSIGGAIYDALQESEEELQVLARHEIVLSSEGLGCVVETQKRFDAKRGCKVAVHTQDPWQSNRILKGLLLDRNALDVYIKKQGRMVTIPNNFVKFVELVDPNDHEPDPEYFRRDLIEMNIDSSEQSEILLRALADEDVVEEEDDEYVEEDEDIYGDSD